ncbi:MAG TPA: beta-L-arabinofuranosidase domain-containing protein [Chitinophaga sp.]|uniref:beta-L-arabinofuranosidase domain-containing protein n=1 Tax=Chitinophaga sp. TaxID=1869181 RepID=UPI002B8697E4|nr:beta-L-arabinofuranosidase domain-containing protein [Chitinophaga sp.]HVI48539.1 beta-L-arabinofuranosidase domain-containing protein [Chitinophaga sp.]
MSKRLAILFLCGLLIQGTLAQNKNSTQAYHELPIGAIQSKGWLLEMLRRQKNGATGNLDKLYPLVMDKSNGWLGGDGDQWERGPYWIDGLLPLAYILKDETLIAKVKPWIEWTLNSQQPDGNFGPSKDYPNDRPGVQRDNSRDWWPKMVMLKVLKQYYTATGDKRVITFLTNYFKYQLKTLPATPLNHWTFWARYRGGDNLQVVYWLHGITGDKFLPDLGELIHKQTFDYTQAFLDGHMLATAGSIHGVNLAQGIKEPAVYYQYHPDKKYLDALKKGFEDLRKFNGMAHGLYGADEALHGNNPTQGSELCSAVEMMFSLESILAVTGNTIYADQLEKIAFNALPAQVSDDWTARQYYQQANQVMITRHIRNFNTDHSGTDICYGLLTGYACCTANMHQGWPKFTQNLWYTTPDKGVAALVYSPCEVKATVAGGTAVTFKEETNYPFDEMIRFTFNATQSVSFPLHLRIPAWCAGAGIKINGKVTPASPENGIVSISRNWKPGDVIELHLPMHIVKNTWQENSVSIERGPLVYALKIDEEKRTINNSKDPVIYGNTYEEIRPAGPWNYGLLNIPDKNLEAKFIVNKTNNRSDFPWTTENAPVKIQTQARRIPSWQLYNEMAGPLPFSISDPTEFSSNDEEITLIPYGCSRLRISQFPVIQ